MQMRASGVTCASAVTNDLTRCNLLTTAYSLHSGFAEANIIKILVNCRPALADNLPRIFHEPGLVRVNGLYRHGYLITPAIANAVTDLLESGPGAVRFPELLVPKESLAR